MQILITHPIPAALLGRTLRGASTLGIEQARAIVGVLCAADAGGCETDPDLGTLAGQHYAARQPTIRRLHRAIRRQLAHVKSETVRRIEEAGHRAGKPLLAAENDDGSGARGVAVDLAFDPARFARGLLATIRNESARGLQTAGNQLWDELGDDAPGDPFELPDPVAVQFLDARQNLLSGVPDEIHAQIVDALREGLAAGDSTRALGRRISAAFGEIGSDRARTIASTETAAAYGFARQEGMTQAGITHKTWLTSHLKNVRAAHAAAERDPHNRLVPTDQPFLVGGEKLMYPGDTAGSPGNTINCHCVALARQG